MEGKILHNKIKRAIMAALGMGIAAICVTAFKFTFFGNDPFMSLMNGLANVIPIPYGTLFMLINLALGLLVFILGRRYIGFTTIFCIFVSGYIVDAFFHLFQAWMPDPTLGVRVVVLLIAIVIQCLGCAFYYTADLGVAPYDAIPLILTDKKVARF